VIRVTIEVLPSGDSRRARVIGRAELANVTDCARISDYLVRFENGRGNMTKAVHVTGFDRESWSAWKLLRCALEAVEETAMMWRSW
jgi:hypothetical protein